MRFNYWISQRLSIGKGCPASTVTGVIIAIVGVALSLIVMELSLAIATGFKAEIRRKIVGFEAPVTVLPPYASSDAATETVMEISPELLDIVSSTVPYATVSPMLDRQAILKTDKDFAAVECHSRGESHDDSFERANMVDGSWPDFADENAVDSIVISKPLANSLELKTGDRIYLYFFVNGKVKARRAFVAGLYQSNFAEYDRAVVYCSMPALQSLDGPDALTATGLALEGIPVDDAPQVSAALQQALLDAAAAGQLDSYYPVTDVTRRGAIYFNWLDLLDTNVVVIFALMLAVAAFTLISSLFIIILDRVKTIGLLRALGASRRDVSHIFLMTALRLVGTGMLAGNAVGIGLLLLQKYTHAMPLNAEMYYLSYVPIEINWGHIVLLNIGVAAGSWLILNLPARLAARIDPADSMRYQ